MARLAAKGVAHSEPHAADWGDGISVEIAPGERLGIYQPRHPSPR